jgi:hypothetical protein
MLGQRTRSLVRLPIGGVCRQSVRRLALNGPHGLLVFGLEQLIDGGPKCWGQGLPGVWDGENSSIVTR